MNIQWKTGRAHGTPFIAVDFLGRAVLVVGMRFIIFEIGQCEQDGRVRTHVYLGRFICKYLFHPSNFFAHCGRRHDRTVLIRV